MLIIKKQDKARIFLNVNNGLIILRVIRFYLIRDN